MSDPGTPDTECKYVLVGPVWWGDLTAELAREHSEEKKLIFPCERCSSAQIKTYHNLLGQHRHLPVEKIAEMLARRVESNPDWIDPTDGAKSDLDLGDGHSLTWTAFEGQRVGGIIRHKASTESGYCEAAFWLRGNEYSRRHNPQGPQWDLTGTFESPTLTPSFVCHCGDHGWIRDGKWIKA